MCSRRASQQRRSIGERGALHAALSDVVVGSRRRIGRASPLAQVFQKVGIALVVTVEVTVRSLAHSVAQPLTAFQQTHDQQISDRSAAGAPVRAPRGS